MSEQEEQENGADAGVHVLDGWDVVVVEGKGIYISGDEDPWLIMSEDALQKRNNELSQVYREKTR